MMRPLIITRSAILEALRSGHQIPSSVPPAPGRYRCAARLDGYIAGRDGGFEWSVPSEALVSAPIPRSTRVDAATGGLPLWTKSGTDALPRTDGGSACLRDGFALGPNSAICRWLRRRSTPHQPTSSDRCRWGRLCSAQKVTPAHASRAGLRKRSQGRSPSQSPTTGCARTCGERSHLSGALTTRALAAVAGRALPGEWVSHSNAFDL
jgi:hypothetical protein